MVVGVTVVVVGTFTAVTGVGEPLVGMILGAVSGAISVFASTEEGTEGAVVATGVFPPKSGSVRVTV
jgi:hypothetical protein